MNAPDPFEVASESLVAPPGANRARMISERGVSPGRRRTLLTQTRRLERLARLRLAECGGAYSEEDPGGETGDQELG